jgi:pyruvate formate lyase activating enzyme
LESLHRARQAALAAGLRYVYIGNASGDEGENTYCPHCGLRLVARNGFAVLENRIRAGRCPRCQERIPGIWDDFRKPGRKISQEGRHVPS